MPLKQRNVTIYLCVNYLYSEELLESMIIHKWLLLSSDRNSDLKSFNCLQKEPNKGWHVLKPTNQHTRQKFCINFLIGKWYLMLSCLTLSIIRWGSRVNWSNPGKGVAPSPTLWCSNYWKGRLQSPTLLFTTYL